MEQASLKINDTEHFFSIVEGSCGEKALDAKGFLKETGYLLLDPGFVNTGICKSQITFVDGEKGILNFRGYEISNLAENSTYDEVALLLLEGELPTMNEIEVLQSKIRFSALIPEHIISLMARFPKTTSPMCILAFICDAFASLEAPITTQTLNNKEARIELLGHFMGTFLGVAFHLLNPNKKWRALKKGASVAEHFITMIPDLKSSQENLAALNALFIIQADHEQNCSTASVKLCGSSLVHPFAAIATGVKALWGGRHGGANKIALDMLKNIHASGGDYNSYLEKAKDKKQKTPLAGFGHRVYKNFDPRALILKKHCQILSAASQIEDPILILAQKLELAVNKEAYFVDRKLYANVDYYSGLVGRQLKIPEELFTFLFAFSILPGWFSQWVEMRIDPDFKIARPRQIYTGQIALSSLSDDDKAVR